MLSRALGFGKFEITNLCMVSIQNWRFMTPLEEAVAMTEEAVIKARDVGRKQILITSYHCRATDHTIHGDATLARPDAAKSLRAARVVGAHGFRSEGLIFVPTCDRIKICPTQAMQTVFEALAQCGPTMDYIAPWRGANWLPSHRTSPKAIDVWRKTRTSCATALWRTTSCSSIAPPSIS